MCSLRTLSTKLEYLHLDDIVDLAGTISPRLTYLCRGVLNHDSQFGPLVERGHAAGNPWWTRLSPR